MPCRQITGASPPSFLANAGPLRSSTSYKTEAECNQACQEGACCDGTTCTVKPQCQCQGTGKVFKGVGTVCSPNPCGRCECSTGIINAKTITLAVSNASLLFSPQDPGSVGYNEMRNGGSCVNDSSIVQWLNGINVTLTDTFNPITGLREWQGQAVTQSHLSPVRLECVLAMGCNGAASLTVKYCPDENNLQTCMRLYGDGDIWRFSVGNPCTAASGTVDGFFSQAVASFSGGGCRGGPGGLVAFRGFNLTYTISHNPLP